MNERQMKAAVDGIELAISKREVELERLKTKRDAMRWREGASVEIERLTSERNEARAEVERLTKERDEAKASARRAASERDALQVQVAEARGVLSALRSEEVIPASHAEKVLVDVAKHTARLGAEEMRNRVVKMLRTSAASYASASTPLRDYARDAALDYVSRIEGWTL